MEISMNNLAEILGTIRHLDSKMKELEEDLRKTTDIVEVRANRLETERQNRIQSGRQLHEDLCETNRTIDLIKKAVEKLKASDQGLRIDKIERTVLERVAGERDTIAYTDEKTAQLGATINAHAEKIDKIIKQIVVLEERSNAACKSLNTHRAELDANRQAVDHQGACGQTLKTRVGELESGQENMKDVQVSFTNVLDDFRDRISRISDSVGFNVNQRIKVLEAKSKIPVTIGLTNEAPHGKYQKLVEACLKRVNRGNEVDEETWNEMSIALEELGVVE